MGRETIQTHHDQRILLFAFLLANLRATIFVYLHPDTSTVLGPAWIEIALWILTLLLGGYNLIRHSQMDNYLSSWHGNWLLALFILLAFISIFWSIGAVATLFRSLELFFASLVAAYIGRRLGPEQLMNALFWFGALVFILSIALAVGVPPTGTMYWAPFDGAWRGMYWHRNHLASLAAFLSIVYLCRMVIAFGKRNANGILDALLYLASIVILFFARSATGFIVFLVLHAALFLLWLWLRLQHRLQRQHYILVLLGGILTSMVLLANLDFVFGLFGRDTSMTGRVGLWSNLIDLASRRLWLGHGFGAVWTFAWFREEIQQLAGWTSQPLIADNGWLDIYLHLGIVGLMIFSAILILAIIRSLHYGVKQKTIPGFFPLLVMIYAIFANITFSLFAETEVFVWFLIVAALFMATRTSQSAVTSYTSSATRKAY